MKGSIKNLIYPNKCIICGKILPYEHTMYICEHCSDNPWHSHCCPICGKPYVIGQAECIDCDMTIKEVRRMIALFPYQGRYKQSVLRWKYGGVRKYARGFAYHMKEEGLLEQLQEVDCLIPVPIAKRRYRKRGFNQAKDLAHEMSKLAQRPVYDLLVRTEETKPQAECNMTERAKNIANTISVSNKIYDIVSTDKIKVAIIDDIYTTGSTIKECVRALKEMYTIECIYIVVICRGI